MISVLLSEFGGYLALAATAVLAALGFGWRQRAVGKDKARREMQEKDHERAKDITRRVHADRAQRVRDLDGTGFRD